MNTRVLRSSGPGVPFKFALLAAGALVVGLGCTTTQSKKLGPPQVLTYPFKFSAGSPCTITQEDVSFADEADQPSPPAHCGSDKKCGRASKQNGDSIRFVSIPPSHAFEVVFDPFRNGSVSGDDKKRNKLDKSLPGDASGSKTYSFSVVAKGCTPLDPIIVIDR